MACMLFPFINVNHNLSQNTKMCRKTIIYVVRYFCYLDRESEKIKACLFCNIQHRNFSD